MVRKEASLNDTSEHAGLLVNFHFQPKDFSTTIGAILRNGNFDLIGGSDA